MAKSRANTAKRSPRVKRTLRQAIEKKQATEPRRSARLDQKIHNSKGSDNKCLSPSPPAPNREHPTIQACSRKRKRSEQPDDAIQPPITSKRPRTRTTRKVKRGTNTEAASLPSSDLAPIDYWSKTGRWPKEYFQQDEETRKYLTRDLGEESWIKKYWVPNMQHLLARKKSSSSLRGRQSEPGASEPTSTTPSDQKPREEKSTQYQNPGYETVLKTKGIFLSKHREGVTQESTAQYQVLLRTDNDVPKDSLFRDDLFEATCEEVRNRNEAKIIQDISKLIVPSAQHLAIRGSQELDILIESVNEGWNNSIALIKPRPQSDYAVGFRREAFTEEQLNKLQPFVGELTDTSCFMATWYMYFPFLTCEVKCGAAALDIADRQNAHSMALAVRGPVELFRLLGREKELNREILAFSISHDHNSARIYGHYPVIEGTKTAFYRHPIRQFSFTDLDGRDKWATYKFTKNVYDLWMPNHFKRLCSVIDQLPADLSFQLSQQSELEFQDTGLSQEFKGHALSQSNADSMPLLGEDSQATAAEGPGATPDTSVSQAPRPFKKPKKRPTMDH